MILKKEVTGLRKLRLTWSSLSWGFVNKPQWAQWKQPVLSKKFWSLGEINYYLGQSQIGDITGLRLSSRACLAFSAKTRFVCSRGQQPTARMPNLACQAISNGTQKLQVSHINFVMVHTEGILTLTCIKYARLSHTEWFETFKSAHS